MRGLADLHTLAAACGVQTSFVDLDGRRRRAGADALVAVLASLGAPIARVEDARGAVRAVEVQRWRRLLEPVGTVWEGDDRAVGVRLRASDRGRLRCRLEREDGSVTEWTAVSERLAVTAFGDVDGERFVERRLPLRGPLPFGYHRLRVEHGKRRASMRVVAAPRRAYAAPRDERHAWGVFAPTYALHSARSWGGGDLGDLERLLGWVRGRGGAIVATLPLLATYMDAPCDPSPYAPVSRLFWNEFFIDVDAVPERGGNRSVDALVGGREFAAEIDALRRAPAVDYREQMALKRRVLERLARRFFANPEPARRAAFRRFARRSPELGRYARFRATTERRGGTWPDWPEHLRRGEFRPGDYSPVAERYHRYVQFVADEQVSAVGRSGLLLDLPLGVHGEGYDVWRHRDRFMENCDAGAPPDAFFSKGQSWGFPPLHPARIRERGHDYMIAVLRHHMRAARALRIDHVMGFHRLYCIPRGHDATEGVYVRYPADELYAVAVLESHRQRTVLVGEDLGTVPRDVRRAMGRRGVQRMFVLQYEVGPDTTSLPDPPARSVASLNTHDMPTFHAFWSGLDVEDRVDLGLLDDDGAERTRAERTRIRRAVRDALERSGRLPPGGPDGERAVLLALLEALAAGPARVVLASLEDLWGEALPQNVPGTTEERPNWSRKMRHTIEEIESLPGVVGALEIIARNRKRHRS